MFDFQRRTWAWTSGQHGNKDALVSTAKRVLEKAVGRILVRSLKGKIPPRTRHSPENSTTEGFVAQLPQDAGFPAGQMSRNHITTS